MTSNLNPELGNPQTSVIITGGASGIGLASARALTAVGRAVAIWDIDPEALNRAAALVRDESGAACHTEYVDMRKIESFNDALDRSRAALPPLGGLVHCAGIVDTGSLEGITPESWQAGIDIHLRALAFLTQAMAGDLAKTPGSAIVAITSMALLQRLTRHVGLPFGRIAQAAAAKCWLSNSMVSQRAEGPMPKALSIRRTSPLIPG